jgi:hypothetical protein
VKRPRLTRSPDHAIWLAMRFLDRLAVADSGCGGCYPAALAHYSGLSKLEAHLALRVCVYVGYAVRRNHGRYYKEERTAA